MRNLGDAVHIQNTPEVNIEFESDPALVAAALGKVIDGLSPLQLSADQSITLELVLAEVVNNVIEHAYAEQPGHPVNIAAYGTTDCVTCQVIDHGKSMPHERLPKGAIHDLEVELSDLPEGGFGWFLIGELTQDIRYSRADGKNHLSFSMPLTDQ